MRHLWWRRQHHGHHIESDLIPRHFGMAGVLARGPNHAGVLGLPDGAVGRTVFGGPAGLHFDEDQGIAFPTNEIHFAGAG